jgi:hypothetical protein
MALTEDDIERYMLLTDDDIKRYVKNQGYVYFIHAEGTNRYKIGRSANPLTRLETLKKQSPFPLKIIKSYWAPDAINEERMLHEHFSIHRIHGEWFVFSDINRVFEFTKLYLAEIAFPYTELLISTCNQELTENEWLLDVMRRVFSDCTSVNDIVDCKIHIESIVDALNVAAESLFDIAFNTEEEKIASQNALSQVLLRYMRFAVFIFTESFDAKKRCCITTDIKSDFKSV